MSNSGIKKRMEEFLSSGSGVGPILTPQNIGDITADEFIDMLSRGRIKEYHNVFEMRRYDAPACEAIRSEEETVANKATAAELAASAVQQGLIFPAMAPLLERATYRDCVFDSKGQPTQIIRALKTVAIGVDKCVDAAVAELCDPNMDELDASVVAELVLEFGVNGIDVYKQFASAKGWDVAGYAPVSAAITRHRMFTAENGKFEQPRERNIKAVEPAKGA